MYEAAPGPSACVYVRKLLAAGHSGQARPMQWLRPYAIHKHGILVVSQSLLDVII